MLSHLQRLGVPSLLLLFACGVPADTGSPPAGDDSGRDSAADHDWTPGEGVAVLERQEATWYQDADGDGFGDPEVYQESIEGPEGWVLDGTDCDDGDPSVHPGAEEVCDGDDDDCDGRADRGEVSTWYSDSDGDGWGHPAELETTCDPREGWVQQGGDCDPSDPAVHPEAVEVCDQDDQDCDGEVDEDFDVDGDGYWSSGCGWVDTGDIDCDDADATVHPEATDVCEDGIDQDCNGADLHCGFVGSYDLGSADAVRTAAGATADGGRLIEVADVDGDGHEDVLAATLYSSTVGAYLAYGPMSGSASLVDTGFALTTSGDACYGSGRSIGMGDTNGDSYLDIIVGCPWSAIPGSRVVLGPVTANLDLDASDAWLYGDQGTYTGHGSDLADLDGDGLADALIGAYNVAGSSGALYISYGPVTGEIDLVSDADATIDGPGSGSYMGRQARGGGDINGDGFGDAMVSAPYANTYGASLGMVVVAQMPVYGNLAAMDADVHLVGESPGSTVGISMAMGDHNGDGYDDMLVGASSTSVTTRQEGAAYLVLGPTSGAVDLGAADAIVRGTAAVDSAGSGVALRDSDGDGYADVLVGAAGESSVGRYSGMASLFYGPLSGSFVTTDGHALLYGTTDAEAAGQGVGIGDVDGDGAGDLIIGASGLSGSGGFYVQYSGS